MSEIQLNRERMNNSTRVIVNTIAQYMKTLINGLLVLYSTKIVLTSLGQADYGIYTVIAGVVAMLSFLSMSLSQATQRYCSYYQGKNDETKLLGVFNNSVLVHIVIGVSICLLLFLCKNFIFTHLLSIPIGRLTIAKSLYNTVIICVLISFYYTPYYALLLSHENIVFTSVVSVVNGLFKLVVAIALLYTSYDKLLFYGYGMIAVELINLILFSLFSKYKYIECVLIPKLHLIDRTQIFDFFRFTGWTAYCSGCILGRTQGVSILLNRYWGATINAAYGIALQLQPFVLTISQSLTNAIRPQAVRSEGASNRGKMLWLAQIESKFSFFLLSLLAVPSIIFMNALLQIWLGEVPEYSVAFCRTMLIAGLCDMWSTGLITAFNAAGALKNYSLIVQTIKLLTIPAAWVSIYLGYGIEAVCCCFVGFELLCSFLRIYLARKELGLNVDYYLREVVLKSILPLSALIAINLLLCQFSCTFVMFLLSLIASVLICSPIFYFASLTKDEKDIIISLKKSILRNDGNTKKKN